MAYCGERTLATTLEGVKTAISLRCRSWGCKDCAADRQRQLIAKALSGNPNRMITLTSRRRQDQTPDDAAKALVRAWRIIRRTIKKHNPKEKVEFLAIFEHTKTGWPHLHILVRSAWLDQHWISAQMSRLTDSPIVDVRAVKSKKGAAHYVAKYIAKGPGKFGTLKRYWTSQAYELINAIKDRKKATWFIEKMTLPQWANMWSKFGFSITWQSTTRVEAHKPP
jgi:hypothetical protein